MPPRASAAGTFKRRMPGAPHAWQPLRAVAPPKYVRLDLRAAPSDGSVPWLLEESTLTKRGGEQARGAGSAPIGLPARPLAAGGVLRRTAALSAVAKRQERASRRKQRGAPALPGGPTAAERQSVSAATRHAYEEAWMAFSSWARQRRLFLSPTAVLDDTLVHYLDQELFLSGDPMSAARTALFGTMYWLGLPKAAPRCREPEEH